MVEGKARQGRQARATACSRLQGTRRRMTGRLATGGGAGRQAGMQAGKQAGLKWNPLNASNTALGLSQRTPATRNYEEWLAWLLNKRVRGWRASTSLPARDPWLLPMMLLLPAPTPGWRTAASRRSACSTFSPGNSRSASLCVQPGMESRAGVSTQAQGGKQTPCTRLHSTPMHMVQQCSTPATSAWLAHDSRVA